LPETDHGLNNYPNPFNPRTTIGFSLEETFDAKLYVFNLSGALVRRIDLGVLPPGEHEAEWDGKDDSGSDVSSGVYFCRLGSDDKRQAAKMLLVR
jgi:flagellar hook assembly protein FlgD